MPLPKRYASYAAAKGFAQKGAPRNIEIVKWVKANTKATSVSGGVASELAEALSAAAPKAGETVDLTVYDLSAKKGGLTVAQYVKVKGKKSAEILVWEDDSLVDVAKLKVVQEEFRKDILEPTMALDKMCDRADTIFTNYETLLDGKGTLFTTLATALKTGDTGTAMKTIEKIETEMGAARTNVRSLLNHVEKENKKTDGAQRAGIKPYVDKHALSSGEEKVVADYFMESTKAVEAVRARVDDIENRLDRFLIKRENTLKKVKGEVTQDAGRLQKLHAAIDKFNDYIAKARVELKMDRLDADLRKGLAKAANVLDDSKALRDQIATYELNLKKTMSYEKEAATWARAIQALVAKLGREPALRSYQTFKVDEPAWSKEIAAYATLMGQYIAAFKKKQAELEGA